MCISYNLYRIICTKCFFFIISEYYEQAQQLIIRLNGDNSEDDNEDDTEERVMEEDGLCALWDLSGDKEDGSTEVAWPRVTVSKPRDQLAQLVGSASPVSPYMRESLATFTVSSFCFTGDGGADNVPQWTQCLCACFIGNVGAVNVPQSTQCLGEGFTGDASPPPRTGFATAV